MATTRPGDTVVPGPIDFWDFAAARIKLEGITITIVGVYLTAGMGIVNEQSCSACPIGSYKPMAGNDKVECELR